jgi:hypothetical protein
MELEYPPICNPSGRDISVINRIARNVFVGNSILFLKSFSQLN